jgi:hypothetical protein
MLIQCSLETGASIGANVEIIMSYLFFSISLNAGLIQKSNKFGNRASHVNIPFLLQKFLILEKNIIVTFLC